MKSFKLSLLSACSVLAIVSGAPLLVWNKSRSESSAGLHSSASVTPLQVFEASLPTSSSSTSSESASSVVFLLGRGADGSESLSSLAQSQQLPAILKHRDAADCYYAVEGVSNAGVLKQQATKARPQQKAVELSLNEYLNLKQQQEQETQEQVSVSANGMLSKAEKRNRALNKAHVLIVNIDATEEPSNIDQVVVGALQDHETVVLAAARSVQEVQHERQLASFQLFQQQQKNMQAKKQKQNRRRRLEEDADQQNADNVQEDQEEDVEGVYYVHMTPNILAGILFFLLFTVMAYTGVTCMNMISGQDVYVQKMPSIGREA